MWHTCKRILCIRADNMGDVIMTTPALRALKESFGAHITLLTSSMAQHIAPYIPAIDDVIVADLPWVKAGACLEAPGIQQLIQQLQQGHYDGAVVFTVYSQSALPAAMLALLAGIPNRLAWCRENPYGLLTDWMPDGEPYRFIQHQVERDLKLVNSIGAFTSDDRLGLNVDASLLASAQQKLKAAGIEWPERYIVFHPGVSEKKRQYPVDQWKELVAYMREWNIPVMITGTANEKELAYALLNDQTDTDGHADIGQAAQSGQTGTIYNVAGLLNVGEFIALLQAATLIVSVNTATVHIAAALQKLMIVLYALTNPQHTPWKTPAKVFSFSVQEQDRSKNEIVSHVHRELYGDHTPLPSATSIANCIRQLWVTGRSEKKISNFNGVIS